MKTTAGGVNQGYQLAREAYAAYGVDTDTALEQLGKIPITLHCWLGNDVSGFAGGSVGTAIMWQS